MTQHPWKIGIVAGLGALLIACASAPPSDQLLLARNAYESIANNPDVARSAAQQLSEAKQALLTAESRHESGADPEIVNHYAYLAQKHAETAREQAVRATLLSKLENAEADRTEVILEARTSQAQAAEARSARLEQQLEDLKAEQTERGMVMTLGDVLFDFDQADLKVGGMRTVEKLVDFLQEYPERRVRIEGYTDSTGDEQYNLGLSERRANAVRTALLDAGISPNRIEVQGYGVAYPVADNNSSSGRQQNRRVEIVISEPDGTLKAR